MFFINTDRDGKSVNDATVNQSLDNYLINTLKLKGHGLIMYINRPSVIIGVHQNAYAEVDLNYLKEKNIALVRRSSGGGAVYQDYGNIIFENIVVGDTKDFGDFSKIAQPILDALHDFGAKGAELHGRNDLMIDGKKFSGMTMVKVGDSYAAGGTLMFDLNMEDAERVLTPDQEKLASKGVKSVNKRVTNIKPYLDERFQNMTAAQFKDELLKHMFHVDDLSEIETYNFTENDWQVIDDRLKGQYDTDEWNFGKNPGFEEYKSKHFDIGTVAFNFTVTNGKIAAFKIYGDFITGGKVSVIEDNLIGTNFDEQSLAEAFEKSDLAANLGKISGVELADLMLDKQ